MKTKLSRLPAPALAGVVRESGIRAAMAEARNCAVGGADMLDLHLSCLEANDVASLRRIIASVTLPVLALHYNMTYAWEDAGVSEEERVACLLRAAEAGADGIDMQGYTFHAPSKDGFCGEDIYSFTGGNPKEIVADSGVIAAQCDLIERVHAAGAEVLLSCHPGIPMKAETVVDLALFLERRRPDIIKIVTRADDEEDLAESIRAMFLLKKELKTPVSYHANGAAGMLSRIINPLLGGQIAFCVDRYGAGSTMEQLDLRTMASITENMKKLTR